MESKGKTGRRSGTSLKKLRKSINQVTIFVSFNGLAPLHGIVYA
jgi:hypothetical protein